MQTQELKLFRKTVARHCDRIEVYAQSLFACVSPARVYRRIHFQLCRLYHNWVNILLTNDSQLSFCLKLGSYHPENIQKRCQCDTCSIMVRSGFTINGFNGTRTCACNRYYHFAQYFIDVLLPHVHLFRAPARNKFMFMEDKAPYLRANSD